MKRCVSRPAAVLALTTLAACQGHGRMAQSLPGTSRAVAAQVRSSAAELFVGDMGSGLISVFSVQHGLPVAPPVRTLATSAELLNIAVASDGTIYAASQSSTAQVAVYAPGAQGSEKPERVLELPGGAWSLAVDQLGYLYAGIPRLGVNVYLPGARDSDKPVVTIPEERFTGGLGLDRDGNLYVVNYANGLTEYATPETDPTAIRSTCFIVQTNLNGVAIAPTGTAFVAVDGAAHIGHTSFISPVASGENGCPFKRRRLYPEPSFHNPVGVAEFNGHLFVSDSSYGSVGAAIVVMDEKWRGHHAPLFVLTSSDLSDPRGVAIGP